ncbi:uncharacterized protein LOC123705382 [Colias croceus]|uniref:uncharacterized protein LOC123705382 n=1 Tax=Colias crocea TaxID=72248 RepID=UPI001E27F344|nr:uncharacterized protein LOC123705382 [Colias croceus]
MSAYETETYFTGNETFASYPQQSWSKVGDFTPFYITIAICSVILGSIIILNFVCCGSRYSDYWLDRHTGNRWIVSIWSATPHKQPPLDIVELDTISIKADLNTYPQAYEVIQKHFEVAASKSRQPITSSQEYLELHKRESDI